MSIVQRQMKVCASKVPPIFEGSFHASFGRYRAVDWQNFLCVIVPNIVLPYLVEYEAKKALMRLVNGCNLALRRTLKEEDVRRMER